MVLNATSSPKWRLFTFYRTLKIATSNTNANSDDAKNNVTEIILQRNLSVIAMTFGFVTFQLFFYSKVVKWKD